MNQHHSAFSEILEKKLKNNFFGKKILNTQIGGFFSSSSSDILTQFIFFWQNEYSIYKTIFGATFSLVSENLVEQFFASSKIFSKKSDCAMFLPLLSPNFMPIFRKSLERFSISIWYTHNARTDKGDITEPVAFAGSILKNQGYKRPLL